MLQAYEINLSTTDWKLDKDSQKQLRQTRRYKEDINTENAAEKWDSTVTDELESEDQKPNQLKPNQNQVPKWRQYGAAVFSSSEI